MCISGLISPENIEKIKKKNIYVHCGAALGEGSHKSSDDIEVITGQSLALKAYTILYLTFLKEVVLGWKAPTERMSKINSLLPWLNYSVLLGVLLSLGGEKKIEILLRGILSCSSRNASPKKNLTTYRSLELFRQLIEWEKSTSTRQKQVILSMSSVWFTLNASGLQHSDLYGQQQAGKMRQRKQVGKGIINKALLS